MRKFSFLESESCPGGIVVGLDNDLFVGRSADGTIYRGRLNEETARVLQAPGEDARISVPGMAGC